MCDRCIVCSAKAAAVVTLFASATVQNRIQLTSIMFFEVGIETCAESEKSHQCSKPSRSGFEGGFERGFRLLVFRQGETSGLVCRVRRVFVIFWRVRYHASSCLFCQGGATADRTMGKIPARKVEL